jgi:hypothetical protein
MIFRILLKTKNAKGNCQTIGVALIDRNGEFGNQNKNSNSFFS